MLPDTQIHTQFISRFDFIVLLAHGQRQTMPSSLAAVGVAPHRNQLILFTYLHTSMYMLPVCLYLHMYVLIPKLHLLDMDKNCILHGWLTAGGKSTGNEYNTITMKMLVESGMREKIY